MSPDPIVDTALVQGSPGIQLQGDHLRLTMFPEAGAKILDLAHLPTGINLLWQNPRVPLRRTYPGAAFDDVWCGGWDELFPTDPPCELDGNTFHDHGDLWHGPWEWSVDQDDGETATVYLRRHTVALPCLMEKWVTLRRDGLDVRLRHRLTNLGTQPVPFAWSLHVAHPIGPDSRIHVPTDAVAAVPAQPGRFPETSVPLRWPVHDGLDLGAVLPAASGLTEWLYAVGLREGWCAVTHPSRSVGLALRVRPAPVPNDVAVGGVRRLARALRAPHGTVDKPSRRSRAQRRRRHRCLDRRRFGDRDRRHGRRARRDRGNRRSRLARPGYYANQSVEEALTAYARNLGARGD